MTSYVEAHKQIAIDAMESIQRELEAMEQGRITTEQAVSNIGSIKAVEMGQIAALLKTHKGK